MPRTVHLFADLAAPPAEIYETYLDPKQHAALTGAPVEVSRRPGSPFSAFGGQLRGTMLHTVENRLIVQAWRSSGWKESDPDSILILSLEPLGRRGTRVDLLHANLPDHDAAGVSLGWQQYYFIPWRAKLAAKPKRARPRR